MHIRTSVAGLLMLALPAAASCQTLSYSHVEAGYASVAIDVEEGDKFTVHSPDLALSWQVAKHVFLFTEARALDYWGQHYDPLAVGAGFRWSLFPSLDLFATVSYALSDDRYLVDAGPGLGLGFRARPLQRLELEASIGGNAGVTRAPGFVTYNLGVRGYLTDALSVAFDHHKSVVGDDFTTVNRGSLRYTFNSSR